MMNYILCVYYLVEIKKSAIHKYNIEYKEALTTCHLYDLICTCRNLTNLLNGTTLTNLSVDWTPLASSVGLTSLYITLLSLYTSSWLAITKAFGNPSISWKTKKEGKWKIKILETILVYIYDLLRKLLLQNFYIN